MEGQRRQIEHRVLICAPTGRDARLIADTLDRHGIGAEVMADLTSLSEGIREGAGAIIVTEEALLGPARDALMRVVATQEAWSDLPVIILTTGGEARANRTWELVQRLEHVGNVNLLERPLRSMTLLSAVRVALRSRRRQYEVRALHEQLERRVMERTAELERLNMEAEGFNYSISHDLRTPLRTINATSQMLLGEYGDKLPENARFLLERQALAANRLAGLIDDLLHLSRLSRQEIRAQSFDLTALANEVLQEMRNQGTHPRCTFNVEPGMKACGDPLLVRFVLLNLLENACKFSPEGGHINIGQHDNNAFFVRDEGIGFDQQYVQKIFLPFERLVTDSEFPGSGIGLANVRRIVERHGGRVWAESELGKGATFFFTL
jgi:signal transduction histidine kinase